jgi:hypothetical protein
MTETKPTLFDQFRRADGKREAACLPEQASIAQIAQLLSIDATWSPNGESERRIGELLWKPIFERDRRVVGRKRKTIPPQLMWTMPIGHKTLQSESIARQRAEREIRQRGREPDYEDEFGLPLGKLTEHRSLLIDAGAREEALDFLFGKTSQASEELPIKSMAAPAAVKHSAGDEPPTPSLAIEICKAAGFTGEPRQPVKRQQLVTAVLPLLEARGWGDETLTRFVENLDEKRGIKPSEGPRGHYWALGKV